MKYVQIRHTVFVCLFTITFSLYFNCAKSQTDIDAIMMSKNTLCTGLMYSHSSWTNYWEGTYKRNNANLGRVTTQMWSIMANYGISNKLNLLFTVPYVQTMASAGTLKGMKGIEDLSLWIKWMPIKQQVGKGTFSLVGIVGYSFPLTNYIADYLPLSIGLHSKSLTGRIMADYKVGKLFVTASGSYVLRNNITIDRTAYYTTTMHLTNEVEMPDMTMINARAGYRSIRLSAEVIVSKMTTINGFDIRKNDMPFPSNKMNATTAGINVKYEIKKIDGLSVTAGYNYTLAGRNYGQASTLDGGLFYLAKFTHKPKQPKTIY